MRRFFIDTGHLLGLAHAQDQWHSLALQWTEAAQGLFRTTDYILVEAANGLAAARFKPKALSIIGRLQSDPRVTIIPASRELNERGFQLYGSRLDKDWSLTDCISFVVMAELGIMDALTPDRHFEQAGFRALLRTPPTEVNGAGTSA
jgi:hypothetical protein